MKTQVVVIGGGPSGLLLSELLRRQGIDSVVLERKTRDYVLGRIRAGILETGTVDLLRQAGISERMDRESLVHDSIVISHEDEQFSIDLKKLSGSNVVVYGQTELTRDLYDAREAAKGPLIFNVENVQILDVDSDHPYVNYQHEGKTHRIDCDFVAGCDGFHGVSRQAIPLSVRREYEKIYPFGWLGILSETPPVNDELIYASSSRGFALCSMRNENLSRYYIQCSLSDSPGDWTDAAFWQELKRRIPSNAAESIITGPSIEKSIAPLRSFVTEPMRWERLFLCGDAAHIVPPTGAKGLNTAAGDVYYLYNGLAQFYATGDTQGIDSYSENALARVWKAVRFSWSLTSMLHRFPHQSEFDLKMQAAEIAFMKSNRHAQSTLAENYVGLPY